MTSYAIGAIEPADIEPVATIHADSFDDPWSATVMRRILVLPGAFGLVARHETDDAICGFALCRVAADECELLSLGVAHEHRRRGVGGMLFNAATEWAAVAGARRFFLEVAEDNDAAIRLYSGRGLTPVGRRPDYYELKGGGHMAALTMRGELRAPASSSE